MKPYTTNEGQVTVIPSTGGRTLKLVKDSLDEQGIIVQVYGERGGLKGTIRLDLSDLREGLLLAGVGTRRKPIPPLTEDLAAQRRLETLDQLSPRCVWDKQNCECSAEERRYRDHYNNVLRRQSEYEARYC